MDEEQKRTDTRIRQYLTVHWSIDKQNIQGNAVALNISSTGMQLLAEKTFKPFGECIFTIEAQLSQKIAFGPKKAKMMWYKRVQKDKKQMIQLGLEFIKDNGFDKQLKNWIEEELDKLALATDVKILTKYIS